MNRLRHDLDFLTSVGLLMTALVTAITGVIADLWDLNDFWYHTISGYAMGAFAIAHVAFNWERLVAYGRFRLRGAPRMITRRPAAPPNPATREVRPAAPAPRGGRSLLSRRGLIGLAVGGIGGVMAGRGLRPAPPIAAGSDVGVIYHEWSKPGFVDALGTVANWGQWPEPYKSYPGVPFVRLPAPELTGGVSAAEAIATRRSTRDYTSTPVTPAELSRFLFLTSGISADKFGNARRTAPSSGALYPIEIYAVVHNVADVERGVYHYSYRDHALELVRPGDHRQAVVDQGLGQEFLGQCGAVLFLTQILQRMRPKYQDRSYRYGLLEAGHIGENAYLAATSMGLGACGIGAYMDDQINDMLGVDGAEEAAVYMLAVGHTA
jgi:SagB-type dehydrogenase family enzyme